MSDPTHFSLAEARDALVSKKLSAVELTRAHVEAIETARALNAFITETPELALEAARDSDARIARGEARPLEGLPLGIKDLYCTKGVRTTAGSRILDDFKPTYEFDGVRQSLARRRGDARQAQSRRIRHGLVQ